MTMTKSFAFFVTSAALSTFLRYLNTYGSNREVSDTPINNNYMSLQNKQQSFTGINLTASIKRNESEFSLGLNREQSLPSKLSELGELCQTGQLALLSLRNIAVISGVFIATYSITLKYTDRSGA